MATSMLNVYDLNRRKTAVLQNAYNIQETKELNQIYHLDFNLPATDEKARYIQAFHYVRYGEDGELYRIVSAKQSESDTSTLTVSCEHVIATLVDDLIFGVFQYGGGTIKTGDVIEALLEKQNTRNWVLGECDFTRRFEYLWEQENILNALYSIPKEFTKAYKWCFDTTSYPWKVSLKAIDTTIHPEYYIRAKSNLLGSDAQQDFTGICTRVYPLGYGEGVNQLGIKEINGGKTYLEAPAEVVARYGIKEKVLVDRRYENAESLMAYGQTVLDALSVPSLTRSFNVIDLYPITGAEIDNAKPGQIAKLTEDGTVTYITKTTRVLDEPGNLQIDLSTKATDIASSIADLAERVRIEAVYAQGATQLYQHSKDANATPSKGMVLSLYFPIEMKQINKVLLRLKLGKFRSYSQATESADVTVESCDSPKVQVDTNEYALDGKKTTQDGGGTTSSSGGTSVTVSGGGSSGSTKAKSVSLNVQAEGVSYAPQASSSRTSPPNTELTSGTTWEKEGDTPENSIWTGWTNNGAIGFDIGKTLTGGTYALYGGNDGYHSHDTEYWESGQIDGGNHNHNVSVDVPTKTFKVINNSPIYGGYGGEYHWHTISRYALAHSHNINHYHTVSVSGSASGGSHSHSFNIPDHTHEISAHSHNLPNLSHKHTITLKPHSHKIILKGHSHEITAGIFESGNPTKFDIYVGGKKKATATGTTYEGDIADWLLTADNQIPRGQWIDIEIRPNDLAYVQSSVFIQGFVQSRGGGNY